VLLIGDSVTAPAYLPEFEQKAGARDDRFRRAPCQHQIIQTGKELPAGTPGEVEDPKVLTKPWIMHSSIMLRPGTRLREYECAENNSDIQHYEQLLKDESLFRRK
jgi:hypothetical protein